MIALCTGVEVRSPIGFVRDRAILLLSSLDLPARAIVTNMKQFNGKQSNVDDQHIVYTCMRVHAKLRYLSTIVLQAAIWLVAILL